MDVVDELSGAAAVVVEDVVAGGIGHLGDGWCDFCHAGGKFGGELWRAFFEAVDVLFGDNEGVSIAKRADIEEGQYEIIFVDFIAGDIAGNNFAEDALVGHVFLLNSGGDVTQNDGGHGPGYNSYT